ncbi:MAG: ISH3 family transposase [Methanobacteriota archaeon]
MEGLITFVVPGHRFSKRDVAELLIYAASRRTSLTRACEDLAKAMSDTRLRQLWSKFEMGRVQATLNRLLVARAKVCLRNRAIRLAVDFHLVPYHGKPHKHAREVYRGPAKSGTSHFHAYATAYVILAGRRFTLAVKFVRKGEDLAKVLRFLLGRVGDAGFKVESLYADRGFCNVRCIRFLQNLSYEVLMPLVVRGKKGRRLLKPRSSYATTYTMNSVTDGEVTFPVLVTVTYAKGRRGEHKAKKYAYVALHSNASPRTAFERYRTRFGIEASYRLATRARARTSTRNPAIRLALFGVALLIENEWVWIKYERLAIMRRGRGGRVVQHALLRFELFLAWIVHALNLALALVVHVESPALSRVKKKRRTQRASRGGGNY